MLLHDVARYLVDCSDESSPRGLKTKELRNFMFRVDDPIMSYECRKLSIPYMKAEARWYLNGDPFDTSILCHSKIWVQIQQSD